MSYVARSNNTQRRIFFEGNSLMNCAINFSAGGGQYIPNQVYNGLTKTRLSMFSYAISGRNQTQINASLPTNIYPYLRENDIIVLWEGANDMYTNGISGADAYANLVTYSTAVRSRGAKLIVCNVIARDYTLDPADLMDTRIPAYNQLTRDNSATICDALVDLAGYPEFNARADASNTTFYNSDKIHQATAGQTLVINGLIAAIQPLL